MQNSKNSALLGMVVLVFLLIMSIKYIEEGLVIHFIKI